MPRAQTPRNQSRLYPISLKPPSNGGDLNPEVLELSEDADSPQSQSKPEKRTVSHTRKKKLKSKPQADVIEISSSEDDIPPSQGALLGHMRSQMKRLQHERDQYFNAYTSKAQELARCQAELKEANAKASERKVTGGKLVLDLSELDDKLSCHICTSRMYAPWLLPDCGHTFCVSCLHSWFEMAHVRFLQSNPHWTPNTMTERVTRIQNFLQLQYRAHPQLDKHLRDLQRPLPEYTCPTCRKRVYRRPVEVFALKSLIQTISDADEAEKEGLSSSHPLMRQWRGQPAAANWDDFFPGD